MIPYFFSAPYYAIFMPIKTTAKRRATFPRAVCVEVHLLPGDQDLVERRQLDGETVWVEKTK